MTQELAPVIYIIAFLYGIVIGSFLNVCIYRIPRNESIAAEHSHCMSCGSRLRWFDLIPVFSYLFLHGKCRNCGAAISIQYPLVELANGFCYILVFAVNGFRADSILFCLMASALLALSIIDLRTYEIPFGFNLFILALGLIRVALDHVHWADYVIGFFIVSLFLGLALLLSKGRAVGGGDVKLMAAAGLLLGYRQILLAFVIGCVLGSVIHLARMKFAGADRVLALGPYLSAGIFLSALWGKPLIAAYLSILHT